MKTCIYVGSNIQKITVKNMQSARKMGGVMEMRQKNTRKHIKNRFKICKNNGNKKKNDEEMCKLNKKQHFSIYRSQNTI